MALSKWTLLTRSIRAQNPWWTYRVEMYELPSGRKSQYHSVHTNGSSMVIPVLPDGRLLLVNQYRVLVDRESVEFPCGSVESGSSHEETAWHELAQETGYSADRLFQIGEFNPYNGVTDEMCRVYLARDLKYVGPNPDETEEFELIHLSPEELGKRIEEGKIWDGMTIAAWGIGREMIKRV